MGSVRSDVSSARNAVAVDVSSSDQDLASGSRALYVGTSGDIAVDMVGGATVTFAGVPAGIFTIQASKIYNSGTTAAGIVALY